MILRQTFARGIMREPVIILIGSLEVGQRQVFTQDLLLIVTVIEMVNVILNMLFRERLLLLPMSPYVMIK